MHMTDKRRPFPPLPVSVRRASVLLALAVAGCGAPESGPVRVMALVPSASGSYEPRAVELNTITSLATMTGDVAQFLVGARNITPDLKSLTPDQRLALVNSLEERLKLFLPRRGHQAQPSFLKRDGVYWPTDFDSWGMSSAYYGLERTAAYFKTLVDDLPEFHHLTVYYSAEVYDGEPPFFPPDGETLGSPNNAAYFPAVDAIIMTPTTSSSNLPTAENIAVLAHEASHRVFNYRAFAQLWVYPYRTIRTFNIGLGLDEGLADFHAVGVTCLEQGGCRPGYMQELNPSELSRQRDLARLDTCMTSALLERIRSDGLMNPYVTGSLFAASLYQTGTKTGRLHDIQRAVMASYDDDSVTPGLRQLIFKAVTDPAAFDEYAVVDSFAAHIPDHELRRAWCGEAADRLRLECSSFPCARLPSCPADSVRGTSCPELVTP